MKMLAGIFVCVILGGHVVEVLMIFMATRFLGVPYDQSSKNVRLISTLRSQRKYAGEKGKC